MHSVGDTLKSHPSTLLLKLKAVQVFRLSSPFFAITHQLAASCLPVSCEVLRFPSLAPLLFCNSSGDHICNHIRVSLSGHICKPRLSRLNNDSFPGKYRKKHCVNLKTLVPSFILGWFTNDVSQNLVNFDPSPPLVSFCQLLTKNTPLPLADISFSTRVDGDIY